MSTEYRFSVQAKSLNDIPIEMNLMVRYISKDKSKAFINRWIMIVTKQFLKEEISKKYHHKINKFNLQHSLESFLQKKVDIFSVKIEELTLSFNGNHSGAVVIACFYFIFLFVSISLAISELIG